MTAVVTGVIPGSPPSGFRGVREVLEQTLASGTFDELAVQRLLASAQPAAAVTVRGYEVERVSAAVIEAHCRELKLPSVRRD